MLIMRIVTAGAVVSALLGLAVASATAQGATESAGKPLPLLQFLQQGSKTKVRPHAKLRARLARKTRAKRHVVKRTGAVTHEAVAAPRASSSAAAADALPQNIWPAPDAARPGAITTFAPAQAPVPMSTEAVVETDPNEIVTGGHSAQPALPDEFNSVDLATDDRQETTQETTQETEPAAAPGDAAEPTPAIHADVAQAAIQSPDMASPVGSASWIAQALAALAGAIAAGVVAWFLIRPAPERTYG